MNSNNSKDESADNSSTGQNKPSPIADLISALQTVNPNDSAPEENATSITDNNGGRIELNDDPEVKK